MRFSHKDKKDKRVANHSTYPLDYPSRVDEAPETIGVYVLLDSNSDVLYVAKGELLRTEIKAKANTPASDGTVAFRWFKTTDETAAKDLELDWIEKYTPNNQNHKIER